MVLVAAVVVIAVLVLWKFSNSAEEQTTAPGSDTSSLPSPNEKVDIRASFSIETNGLVRNFSDPKYHNLSTDVYIEASDPTVVHVKKPGITWHDFFKTLPMELTKECLTTGTKQTFCTGSEGTLKFYVNEAEDKDLLDKEIMDGDKAQITFSKD